MVARHLTEVVWEVVHCAMTAYLERQHNADYLIVGEEGKSAWTEEVVEAWNKWRRVSDRKKDKVSLALRWIKDHRIMETLSSIGEDLRAGMSKSYVHQKCFLYILSQYKSKPKIVGNFEEAFLEVWVGLEPPLKVTRAPQDLTAVWPEILTLNLDLGLSLSSKAFMAFLDIAVYMAKNKLQTGLRELMKYSSAPFEDCLGLVGIAKGLFSDEIGNSVMRCINFLENNYEDLSEFDQIDKLLNQKLRIETVTCRKRRCNRCLFDILDYKGPNLQFAEAKALFRGERAGEPCTNCQQHLVHTIMVKKSMSVLVNKHGEGASSGDQLMSLNEAMQTFGEPVDISQNYTIGLVSALCCLDGNPFVVTFRDGVPEKFLKTSGFHPLLAEQIEASRVDALIFGPPILNEEEADDGNRS